MFNPLCLLLIATLFWQHVFSRHLVERPHYLPYSDYSYTYSGPGPLYHQQHHSPFFSPPGTYFDHRQGILRPFPGGGVPIIVDYHKRCSNQYVGLKAHPDQQQYYYVCKRDSVIFGKCQNLQIFNATSGQCVQHPPPEYKPTCTAIGRFPLFSDCHLYYKCEEDLQPKIYSCPQSMVFSPISKKCINGNRCTPTQISPHSSYIPEVCSNKFPPCFENGVFRSPSDCSLYYKCDLKKNGVYMQTRLRCPQGNFYDLQKNQCLPAKEVPCDCIQVAELVYPKPNNAYFQPPVYPAQFELDSLEEGQYPIEQTKEEVKNSCNVTDSSSVVDVEPSAATTLAPTSMETLPNEESIEQNDETAVLSDYIDMGDQGDKSLEESSKESEEIPEIPNSSEEAVSNEGSSFETNSLEAVNFSKEQDNETIEEQSENEIESTEAYSTEELENTSETVTTNDASTDITNEIDNLIENEENSSTEGSVIGTKTEIKTTNFEEVETTVPFKEIEQDWSSNNVEEETTTPSKEFAEEKETTTPRVSTRSIKSQPCEHITQNGETNDKDTKETKIKQCLAKLINISSNIDTNPMKTITFLKNTPPGSTNTSHKQNSINFTTIATIPATTQSLITKIMPAVDNLVKLAPETNNSSNILEKKKTMPEPLQTIHGLNVDIKKLEEDKNQIHTTIPQSTAEEKVKLLIEPAHKTKETSQPILQNFTTPEEIFSQSFGVPLGNNDLELEKSLQSEKLAVKTDSPTQNKNLIFDRIEGDPTSLKEDNGPTLVDFIDEEFIPVHTTTTDSYKLPGETTDFENMLNDYTTIISEKELTAAAATTIATEISQQQEQTAETFQTAAKETTLKRREATLDKTSQLRRTKMFSSSSSTTSSTIQTTTTAKTGKISTNENFHENLKGFLDSEIVIHGQSEEVRNNEISSAETIQTTSHSKQQQFPHIPSRDFTHTTKSIISEPIEKHKTNFILHVRKEDHEQPSLELPPSQSLFYTLKNIPVINNNENKSINESVTAPPSIKSVNGHIPRLEIIAERPVDVHFSICPNACDKNHAQTNSSISERAVLLKWFANKSKQTLGFETANEISTDDD